MSLTAREAEERINIIISYISLNMSTKDASNFQDMVKILINSRQDLLEALKNLIALCEIEGLYDNKEVEDAKITVMSEE